MNPVAEHSLPPGPMADMGRHGVRPERDGPGFGERRHRQRRRITRHQCDESRRGVLSVADCQVFAGRWRQRRASQPFDSFKRPKVRSPGAGLLSDSDRSDRRALDQAAARVLRNRGSAMPSVLSASHITLPAAPGVVLSTRLPMTASVILAIDSVLTDKARPVFKMNG